MSCFFLAADGTGYGMACGGRLKTEEGERGSFSLGRGSTGEEKRSDLLADFNWRGVFQENCKRRAREESLRFDYFAP